MKADLTRETFAPERHYSRVIQQQGRVPLDADWNEQAEIQDHHDATETIDVIGPAGFPQGTSFELTASPDKSDLLIGDGNGYVAGILAENVNSRVEVIAFPAASQLQLRTLVLDGVALRAGEWLYIDDSTQSGYTPAQLRIEAVDAQTQTVTLTASATASPAAFVKRVPSYIVQPDWYGPDLVTSNPPALPTIGKDGTYVAYLDVWRRHVTALQDPHLREIALRGPDTCTRAKTVWQVKLEALAASQPADCTAPLPADASTGRLRARARKPTAGDSPCVISPEARYRSLENQLYRVEIHDPGPIDTATFKFSRDNGMVMVSWVGSSGADLAVSSLGRDKVLGFAPGQWIELLDDSLEEAGTPGTLARIKSVDAATRTITIDTATVTPPASSSTRGYDINNFPLNPRIRRWDHVSSTAALTVSRPSGDGYLDLEQGVQVRFEDGNYATGDYWLIPARSVDADVEWPRNESGDPLPQPRRGITHHVARLGIVTVSGGLVTKVTDCRSQFPPLTQPSAGCCCGVRLQPDDDAQSVIDTALAGAGKGKIEGLTIDFAAGTFQVGMPIQIAAPTSGGGHLVVKGCGSSTRLVAPEQESVLRIVGWDSVELHDLYVEAGITATGSGKKGRPDQEPPPPADINRHLLGAVYVHNCGMTHAERLEIRCASGSRREASCLSVWNDVPRFEVMARVLDAPNLVAAPNPSATAAPDTSATAAPDTSATAAPDTSATAAPDTSATALDADVPAENVVVPPPLKPIRAVPRGGESWVRNCRFRVGHMQVGVLLVNQRRATVADNLVETYPLDAAATAAITTSPTYLGLFRTLTARDVTIVPSGGTYGSLPGYANVKFNVGDTRVEFRTHSSLTTAWEVALRTIAPVVFGFLNPPKPLTRKLSLKLRTRFHNLAYALLEAATDPSAKTTLTPKQLAPFKAWIANRQVAFLPTASAGIVIGGQVGGDLRVSDNTVSGALGGIHLGLSHHVGADAPPDAFDRVQVVGNTVAVTIPFEITHGRHRGIFVGNAKSSDVRRNRVEVAFQGQVRPQVEGVSVWGKEGPFAIVAENDISGASVGVRMQLQALQAVRQPQWLAQNNATFGCHANLKLSDLVSKSGNLPRKATSGNLP